MDGSSSSSSFHFKIPKHLQIPFNYHYNNIINNKHKVIVYNKVKRKHKARIIITKCSNNIQRDLNLLINLKQSKWNREDILPHYIECSLAPEEEFTFPS